MAADGEVFRMTVLILALCLSILLMVVCAYHWFALKRVYKGQDLRKLQQVVKKAKKALQCGKLTAVEIAVLASQAGMTLENVEEEYRRDSQARQEVLMSVLGDRQNPFVRKFLRHYPSRFLSCGYNLEEEFLHIKESEREADLKEIRTALGKTL